MMDWTEDRVFLQNSIEKDFKQRVTVDRIRNKNIPQMQNNTGH
jgi:hypothetical protein